MKDEEEENGEEKQVKSMTLDDRAFLKLLEERFSDKRFLSYVSLR